jgi:hypothetical protein
MDPYWNWDTIQLTDACIHHAPDDDPKIGVETCSVSNNKNKNKCWRVIVYSVVLSEILLCRLPSLYISCILLCCCGHQTWPLNTMWQQHYKTQHLHATAPLQRHKVQRLSKSAWHPLASKWSIPRVGIERDDFRVKTNVTNYINLKWSHYLVCH